MTFGVSCQSIVNQKDIYSQLTEIKIDWLVVLYGISTLVGYLMPNPVYIHIINIHDL